jgi:hypothetical protein
MREFSSPGRALAAPVRSNAKSRNTTPAHARDKFMLTTINRAIVDYDTFSVYNTIDLILAGTEFPLLS